MLELQNIKKDYLAGENTVHALKGISLQFREHEFVSILGPSGCGKTTMLNIIGGLDQYTSGDLVINGKSTRDYNDKDWDTYRNHSIGFVFQSYNLIPHQTVLQNVELALSLSGVPKKERILRATEALKQVGLGDQLHKKPSEMSGGQMQRVAIARALVNNPDILLLDEPTGALDTETSLQVMDILKSVASDRLVIMVTHNPELADKYSSRIIRMLDGVVLDDSMPLSDQEIVEERAAAVIKASEESGKKRPSLKFWTSFGLSLKNLSSKLSRTALTSFAGSIGIIGIALIYAVSQGTNDYIDSVQKETLSSYPLTIESESMDMTSLVAGLTETISDDNVTEGVVSEKKVMSQVFAQVNANDIGKFKTYYDENSEEIASDVNAVLYGYGVEPQIYTIDVNGDVLQVNPSQLFSNMMSSMYTSMSSGVFTEMIDNQSMLDEQYEILAGRWPSAYNELVMVLSDENKISDYMTYSLGLRDSSNLSDMLKEVMAGNSVPYDDSDSLSWTYDDMLTWEYSLVNNSDLYQYNEEYNVWEDMSDDEDYMRNLVDNSEKLKIVGVVILRDGVTAGVLQSGINYRSDLVTHVIDNAMNSDIVKAQLANPDIDVFSGKSFDDVSEDSSSGLDFNDMISVDSNAISNAIGMNISEDEIQSIVNASISDISSEISENVPSVYTVEADLMNMLTTMATNVMTQYYDQNKISIAVPTTMEVAPISTSQVSSVVDDYMASDGAKNLISLMTNRYILTEDVYTQLYTSLLQGMLTGYISAASTDPSAADPSAYITSDAVSATVTAYTQNVQIISTMEQMATNIINAQLQKEVLGSVGTLSTNLISTIAGSFHVDPGAIASAFSFNMDEEDLTRLMSTYTSGSTEKTYESNLLSLSYADFSEPTSMSIYVNDFDGKDRVKDFIDDYNDKMESDGKDALVINYTDITGLLMSSVRTIINAITYVLIAFVSISLIVSSIMIGVITLISVQERTKEIGILRAIGASKKNVSGMFNAETVIIGFISGLFGVVFTALICIPINLILHKITGLPNLSAVLPLPVALVLIAISILLTLISGIIPSRSAARKDPVVALRSE